MDIGKRSFVVTAMGGSMVASPLSRFLVRQGSNGWMVYDRQRKGPAMVRTNPAVNLTKEQANGIQLALMAPPAETVPQLNRFPKGEHSTKQRPPYSSP